MAQTVSLTDILASELELGFDLTNDNVVGDRIVELTQQLPVSQRGAPSVVELASGSYAVDFDGNATVGQLKSVINLKTSRILPVFVTKTWTACSKSTLPVSRRCLVTKSLDS